MESPISKRQKRSPVESAMKMDKGEGVKMDLFPYLKSLVDMDKCAVVICSLEHEIIYMNPAAARRYANRGGKELLGKLCIPTAMNRKIKTCIWWRCGKRKEI